MSVSSAKRLADVTRWRNLVELCANADPVTAGASIGMLGLDASHWMIPSVRRQDAYVFAALGTAAKAYAAQDSIRARLALCDPLKGLAAAVLSLLDREAPIAANSGRRFRADLDG